VCLLKDLPLIASNIFKANRGFGVKKHRLDDTRYPTSDGAEVYRYSVDRVTAHLTDLHQISDYVPRLSVVIYDGSLDL